MNKKSLLAILIPFFATTTYGQQNTARMNSGVNVQVISPYTVTCADALKLLVINSPIAFSLTLPAASACPSGTVYEVSNIGIGSLTITPTSGTIDTTANISLTPGSGLEIFNDGTNYFTEQGRASAGIPGLPINSVQCNVGGSFGACKAKDDGTNFILTENFRPKGVNPYSDITVTGNIRDVNPSVPPQTSGINATCTNGQPTVVLSNASTFQNLDGVVVQFCGPAITMSPPVISSVTPSLPRVLTGTGDVVAGPTGSTTYNYKVMACDLAGGCTAPSAIVSTTTGAASLGSQTVSLTSATRSNGQVTFLTATPHGLPVGCSNLFCPMVYIQNTADSSFKGYYHVDSVPDNTHFTFTSGYDTRTGASAATTGGTATYYNVNHVTYSSAGSAAFQYYLYSDRANPGTFALVAHSWPINPYNNSFTDNTLTMDDYGSPMNDNFTTAPWYVPLTAPTSATNDELVTTIVSGGTSTTLTLAANASNNATGTIRFDDAPNLKTAALARGTTYIPLDVRVILNSALDMSAINPAIVGGNGMTINDTLLLGGSSIWDGTTFPIVSGAGQFTFKSYPQIQCNVTPCIFFTNNGGGYLADLQFNGRGNQQTILEAQGIGGSPNGTFKNVYVGGTGSGVDSLSIGTIIEGTGGHYYQFNYGGQQATLGSNSTPAYYCDGCGQIYMEGIFASGREMLVRAASAGTSIRIKSGYTQGGLNPYLTVTGLTTAGNAGLTVDAASVVMDTIAQPFLTYLPSAGSLSAVAQLFDIQASSSGVPTISGNPFAAILGSPTGINMNNAGMTSGNAIDGLFKPGNNSPAFYPEFRANAALVTGAPFPNFVNGSTPAQPTCSVNSGGSLSIGTHTYQIMPVWWNNAEGNVSPASAGCVTNSGNQSITVNWTTVPGNVRGYNLYRDGGLLNLNGCFNSAIAASATSFIDDGSHINCQTPPSTIASGGPSVLMPGSQGIATPLLEAAAIVGNGLPCTNTELGLSGGWGGGTVSAVVGTGVTCSWTVTTGNSTTANPTITDTLTNPLPNALIACEMNIHGGTHVAIAGEGFQQTSLSATAPIFTSNFTPTANATYFITRRCGP